MSTYHATTYLEEITNNLFGYRSDVYASGIVKSASELLEMKKQQIS